mmetsp:Transcript_1743/g.7584  ORF Transcript_1743/g.7584 Transcript_1743/m.7584 type:complete len:288 (-) Transcript_1743:6-869(-)
MRSTFWPKSVNTLSRTPPGIGGPTGSVAKRASSRSWTPAIVPRTLLRIHGDLSQVGVGFSFAGCGTSLPTQSVSEFFHGSPWGSGAGAAACGSAAVDGAGGFTVADGRAGLGGVGIMEMPSLPISRGMSGKLKRNLMGPATTLRTVSISVDRSRSFVRDSFSEAAASSSDRAFTRSLLYSSATSARCAARALNFIARSCSQPSEDRMTRGPTAAVGSAWNPTFACRGPARRALPTFLAGLKAETAARWQHTRPQARNLCLPSISPVHLGIKSATAALPRPLRCTSGA